MYIFLEIHFVKCENSCGVYARSVESSKRRGSVLHGSHLNAALVCVVRIQIAPPVEAALWIRIRRRRLREEEHEVVAGRPLNVSGMCDERLAKLRHALTAAVPHNVQTAHCLVAGALTRHIQVRRRRQRRIARRPSTRHVLVHLQRDPVDSRR